MSNNKMTKQTEQYFIDSNNQQWQELKDFPGAQILPLAVPVPQGSIHRLKIAGTFWSTPANTKNGPHQAITDVEIITIRLGAMAVFER